MGVPTLFRWLSSKYPKITDKVIEDLPPENINDTEYFETFDFSVPNPNGFEVDNLYLDMNGIVHPCCHPEGKEAPKNEQEMMQEIFKYLDRIMTMVRPRKLVYMAVDGVAPRAKMNQQRSRRFKAALDSKDKLSSVSSLEEETGYEDQGDSPFDTNCITPGTPFMEILTASLREYVTKRISSNLAWKTLCVILSDPSVPGEGEHKIMDFIRQQRTSPSYNPNETHVIYGLDADLIMLSLATHEPRFRILREDVFFEETRKYNMCFLCNSKGHFSEDCPKAVPSDSKSKTIVSDKPFIFLDISVLREYLEWEFKSDSKLPIAADFERLVDDWVFMSFFIGNDFLPHLPSLDIREGAIDMLVEIYKNNFTRMGGYVTKDGHVYLERIQILVEELGKREESIFIKRKEVEERKEAARKRRENEQKKSNVNESEELLQRYAKQELPVVQVSDETSNRRPLDEDLELKTSESKKARITEEAQGDADEVRLWQPGAKQRYYQSKLKFDASNQECLSELVKCYIEGLCWVMAYYYQGCASWKWFYPFHYAPLASDFNSIDKMTVKFEKSIPFKAFEQLMSVLPSGSKSLIPQPFHWLMTDERSEIFDFYPLEFPIDLNGKKHAWQGIILLPFIDEMRLLKAVEPIYSQLSEQDQVRNRIGQDLLYITNELKHKIITLENETYTLKGCVIGNISKFEETEFYSCYVYSGPTFPAEHKFLSKLLKGTQLAIPVLTAEDKNFPAFGSQQRFNNQNYNSRPSGKHSRTYERPGRRQY